ncbi:TPA: hypothetical protein IWN89_002203 [Enterococcus faecium]|nr:hypothetical protein [Enterococcus faecium]HAR1784254.1 hypothetical protein [Enterococcus faecium]HCR4100838.1 transposase [Enterococcus faecium]
MDVKDGETQENWASVFEGLKERGLSGVKMVISDAHIGLTKAVKEYLLCAS